MSIRSSVYEVLMYIFDHYMEEESAFDVDQDIIVNEMEEVGFNRSEVRKAFAWLESLTEENHLITQIKDISKPEATSLRVFTESECEKLPADSRGFLLYLEQVGVLDTAMRELVLDRALALETDKIDIDQLKWVALMVLFNQSDPDTNMEWIEDLVFNEPAGSLH